MLATRPWPQGVRMAERSKRRERKPQVSQVRSLMEGIGGDGLTDTAMRIGSINYGLAMVYNTIY